MAKLGDMIGSKSLVELLQMNQGDKQTVAGLKFDDETERHILAHTVELDKDGHTVFTVSGQALWDLIDEAWTKRGNKLPTQPYREAYHVDMGRPIGTKGEMVIRMVVREGTKRLTTCFPLAGSENGEA